MRRLLAAALAAGAVVAVVTEVRPPLEPRVAVVVAARPVAAGEVLSPSDVRLTHVVTSAVQPGAVTSLDAAAGRRVVAALVTDEALTASRLVPRGPADGLPAGRVTLHVVAADPAAVDLLRPGGLARVYPVAAGPVLARAALVLSTDPVGSDDRGAARARGVVLALSSAEADAVVSGHGGLDGPVTVALVAVTP